MAPGEGHDKDPPDPGPQDPVTQAQDEKPQDPKAAAAADPQESVRAGGPARGSVSAAPVRDASRKSRRAAAVIASAVAAAGIVIVCFAVSLLKGGLTPVEAARGYAKALSGHDYAALAPLAAYTDLDAGLLASNSYAADNRGFVSLQLKAHYGTDSVAEVIALAGRVRAARLKTVCGDDVRISVSMVSAGLELTGSALADYRSGWAAAPFPPPIDWDRVKSCQVFVFEVQAKGSLGSEAVTLDVHVLKIGDELLAWCPQPFPAF